MVDTYLDEGLIMLVRFTFFRYRLFYKYIYSIHISYKYHKYTFFSIVSVYSITIISCIPPDKNIPSISSVSTERQIRDGGITSSGGDWGNSYPEAEDPRRNIFHCEVTSDEKTAVVFFGPGLPHFFWFRGSKTSRYL